jgi:hypothetical protein
MSQQAFTVLFHYTAPSLFAFLNKPSNRFQLLAEMNWDNRYIHKEQEEHSKQYSQIQSASRPRPNCFPGTFKAEFCANENDVIACITKVKKHTILSVDRAIIQLGVGSLLCSQIPPLDKPISYIYLSIWNAFCAERVKIFQ